MGLKSTVQKLVGTAFSAVGDLKKTVDYFHVDPNPDYDTTTGEVTRDPASFSGRVGAVLLTAKAAIDRGVMPTDLVEVARPGDWLALIPNTDLKKQPTTGDEIIFDDEKWLVKGIGTDPAEALWKVLIRRLGGGAEGLLQEH